MRISHNAIANRFSSWTFTAAIIAAAVTALLAGVPPAAAETSENGIVTPDSPEFRKAQQLMSVQEYSRAVEIYSKLLADDSTNVYIMFNYGTALNYLREQTRSIEVLSRCAQLIEKNGPALSTDESELLGHVYNNLSKSHFDVGNVDAALEDARKGVERHPKLSWLYYNMAEALKAKGMFELAIDGYQKALAIDPNDIAAGLRIVECFYELKKYDSALNLLKEMNRTYPNDEEIKFNLGSALYKNGDREGAVAAWQEVASRNPDSNYGKLAAQWLAEIGVRPDLSKAASASTVECDIMKFSFVKPAGFTLKKSDMNPDSALYMMSRLIYDAGLKDTADVSLSVSCETIRSPQSYRQFVKTWQENQKSSSGGFQILSEKDMPERSGAVWEYQAEYDGKPIKGCTFAGIDSGKGVLIWLNATSGTFGTARSDFDALLASFGFKK